MVYKYRNKNRHSKGIIKGISLIELITGIAIFGLISVMVVSIYFAHFKFFSNQSKTIDLANESRNALEDITNQIRESSTIVSTCTPCGSNSTSSTVLILELWPLDTNGYPQSPGASDFDYIMIKRDDLENTKLTMTTYPSGISSRPSSSKILSEDVSNLTFEYNPPGDPTAATEVTITLTNTSGELGKTHTLTQEAKAVLRNK